MIMSGLCGVIKEGRTWGEEVWWVQYSSVWVGSTRRMSSRHTDCSCQGNQEG